MDKTSRRCGNYEDGAAGETKGKTPVKIKGKQQKLTKHNASAEKTRPAQNDIFTKKQEPPFENYWSKEDVSAGLKSGSLLQGVIRINQRDYNEAFINDPNDGPDYFISGVWARNRALEGDTVAFEVLPSNKWEPLKETETREGKLFYDVLSTLKRVEIKGNDIGPSDTRPLEPIQATSLVSHEATPPEDMPQKPTLIDALYNTLSSVGVVKKTKASHQDYISHGKDIRKYRRTVKVVYIISRGHSRASAGFVRIFNKDLKLALFSSKDSRVPRVILPLSDLPDDFCQNCRKYENTLFICRLIDWTILSPFPHGQLMRSLGEAGEIEPETASILAEYDIDDEEFPKEITDSLPSTSGSQWEIPEEEVIKRRDFRNDCVISIDPSTARDLDDALHCKLIGPGIYEVGVHIADVSYFLSPGSQLDKQASDRATSVYLIQKVIPMLPRQLCEELCSLNPHEDRLTFSVVWKLTLKGELLEEWMGRTIICSRAKLSYDDAQRMIEGPQLPWQHTDFPCTIDPASMSTVVQSVVTLNKIAKQLRFLRQCHGTLRLDQAKLVYSLDNTTGLPNGCNIYQHQDSNKLIEEFMLLTNMAVARRISTTFPDIALLRRHPPPKGRSIESLRDQLRSIGVVLDLTTAGDLQRSIAGYQGKTPNTLVMEKQVIINMCCKVMELAQYFCTGCIEEEHYHHYALNVPQYTHFTSPIRRYADVIVHRLLAAALGEGPPVTLSTEDIEDRASHCNKKRKNAKIAQELSSNLFLGIFIRECGPIVQQGIVTGILNKSFDVMIPELALVKRVYCEKLSLTEFNYDLQGEYKEPHLLLVWKEDVVPDKKHLVQDLTVFTIVEVVLTSMKKSLQFEATINPNPPQNSKL